MMTE
jgi:alpha-aminoadipate carrier protein LysW